MGLQLCLFTASFKSAFAYTLFTDHKGKFLAPIISIHYFHQTSLFNQIPDPAIGRIFMCPFVPNQCFGEALNFKGRFNAFEIV